MTPFERVKLAWDSADRREALNRVVELMASEGVPRDSLDDALGTLLDEVRAAGADDETEEIIMAVGDRLHDWVHESRRIVTASRELPSAPEIGLLPRWARVAFAVRSVRRVLPIFRSWSSAPRGSLTVLDRIVETAEFVAREGRAPDTPLTNAAAAAAALEAREAGQLTAAAAARAIARLVTTVTEATSPFGLPDDDSQAAAEVVEFAVEADHRTATAIVKDYDAFRTLAVVRKWDDHTPVSPDVVGALWPDGPPFVEHVVFSAKSVVEFRQTLDVQVVRGTGIESDPLVEVYFADDRFTPDDLQLFLDYLAATYRDLGGVGLKVVEGQTLVPQESEVRV